MMLSKYNWFMAKRKGKYVPGPGREPLFDEDMIKFQVYLPASYHAYVKRQAKIENISMNMFIRRLIAQDMQSSDKPGRGA